MKKKMICWMAILFTGCHSGEKSINYPFIATSEGLEYRLNYANRDVQLLDSLLTSLMAIELDDDKSQIEWSMVRQIRQALGVSCGDIHLLDCIADSLDSAYEPLTAYSPHDINTAFATFTATARFRLLNAYQLADSLSLLKDYFPRDYALWKDIFREYETTHACGRSCDILSLSRVYMELAELRRELLFDEMGYSQSVLQHAKYPSAVENHWELDGKAICRWYDFRMEMAASIERENKSLARKIRLTTHKGLSLFLYYFAAEAT